MNRQEAEANKMSLQGADWRGNKVLVIETFFAKEEQNFYYLLMPKTSDNGYYRAASSFNAFFNSTRNPKANVTEVRQFTADIEEDIKHRKALFKDVDWDNLHIFENIWEFYDFIGWDRKARKYKSGETLKTWNGTHFIVPRGK